MANIVDFNKLSLTDYPNTFNRGGSFPLDKSSLYYSLAEAQAYARSSGDSSIAYVGQLLTVYENGSTTVWKINDAEGNLVQIDGEVIVDVNVDPADGKVYATVPVKVADPSKWTQSNQTNGNFSSITYGDGKFVASGENGIYYSTNGSEWNPSDGTYAVFDSITYADGKFVAGGFDGVWYSTNGSEWTQSNASESFYSVSYGDGKFVAASRSTGIWYSTNGSEWTQSNKTTGEFYSIAYVDGKFVAVGSGIWYSTNGTEWTQSNKTDGSFYSVTYADGKFVASGTSGIWYSTNGSEWTLSDGTDVSFRSITYADGKFVAGSDYDASRGIWYSIDGNEWIQSSVTSGSFYSIAYADGKFVAVSNSNTGIWYSDSIDGTAKKQLAYKDYVDTAISTALGGLTVENLEEIQNAANAVANKADKSYVDDGLAAKADVSYVNEKLDKKLDIETAENDYLKKTDAADAYTVTIDDTATPGDGVAKVYTIKQGETTVGTINIPKDLVVKEGRVDGTNIILVLNDANETEITIPASDLIEYVTSGSATGDMVVVTVDSDHKVTATITDGTITKDKLVKSVQDSLDKADAAAVKSEVDGALKTINETLEDHEGRIDTLEKATTLADAKAYTDAEIQKLDGSATIASVVDGVVTIKAGITETDGKVDQGAGDDITLAKVATTGMAEDISIADAEGKITATTVEGALTELAKAIDSHHTVITSDTAGIIKYGDEGCGDNYQEVAIAYKDGENLGKAVTRIDESVATLTADENTEGSVAKKVKDAIDSLDSTASQTAGADGLALSITQVDGKITAISGSIAAETYDAHGAAAQVKTDVIGTDDDVSTADTIKGAKKYAQEVAASEASKVSSKIYLGTTTTSLVDNNISTIKINDEDAIAATGSMAMYNGELYIWTGSKWEAASKHTTELATKADKTYVDEELAKKVDKTTNIAGVDLQDNITKEELLTALNVEDGAQVNKIEVVKVGGVALTITDKSVDIDNLILDGGGAITTIA